MPPRKKTVGASGIATYGDPVVLVAPGTDKTATYDSPGISTKDYSTLRLTSQVTAVGGTSPTLDVTVQTSPDNSTWSTLGTAFTQQTGVNTARKVFNGVDRFVRAHCVIGGSAGQHVTFGVTGEGV